MKKSIFLLVATTMVFLVFQVQGAEWVYFSGDSLNNVRFYDRETLTKLPNGIIKVWDKKEYSKEGRSQYIQALFSGALDAKRYEKLSHTLSFSEINCATRQEKLMTITNYSSEGLVLDSATSKLQPSEGWNPITPESIGEALYKVVCPPQKK